MVIREAIREDVSAIVALLADDGIGRGRERIGDATYLQAFDRMSAQPQNVYMVVEEDGEILACLQYTVIHGMSRAGASRAQIESVRVASSYRGLGIGERLLEAAIDRARSDDCALVQLTTDKTRDRAERFYNRLGFQTTHHGMKLTLDQER
ncbi:MAG: GNAT family N-acetyltransferase [Pseudomonadota bacterium]